MKRQERADRIGEILDGFYETTPIPLDHHDAFTLLVAVLLSAQTTDVAVNQVTPELFALADTPAKMAALTVEEIAYAIRRIGLAPTKAKHVRRLSEMLLEDHGGEVPDTFEALERLPGVGHKTASVVMSQWFGHPAFPVDTHIHRLAHRWDLTRGTNVDHTERDLKRLFAPETWQKRHLQIIFFGREYCPARNHDFDACPICTWACSKAFRAREQRRQRQKRTRR